MVFLVAEDEPIILKGEMDVLRSCVPQADVHGFTEPEQVLTFIKQEPADVVFLDIRMPGCSGLELAREIKALCPRTNIIFVTAYDDYYKEALELHVSGYILKPMTAEDVTVELAELRYPKTPDQTGLFVRAFGDFEAFYNGVPLHFRYQKTRELFAYLIDRCGAVVTAGEIIAILWEGQTDKKEYYKQVRKDLIDTLKETGCEDILFIRRGGIGIITEKIRCDYYMFMDNLPEGLNAYLGEYMNQFDWAEPTRAALEMKGDLWN